MPESRDPILPLRPTSVPAPLPPPPSVDHITTFTPPLTHQNCIKSSDLYVTQDRRWCSLSAVSRNTHLWSYESLK
ncbi:hypothetical protein E2C01_026381 [Portunus trituberculatus]|uniref:Uncharacterized protein n=1 Tax=Portunus trituberculatus TaxID=210409 RepID=A0A5B7EJ07_PORTR|nr:hypothetical protein [Portunus trituberculatus]